MVCCSRFFENSILIFVSDFCMSELARDVEIVNTFKRWVALDTQDDLEELELRMAGALCLGNLARSGMHLYYLLLFQISHTRNQMTHAFISSARAT